MELYSGGKRHCINVEAIKAMTYEEIEIQYKSVLDYKFLCRELGIKPTPKKRKKTEEE